MPATVQGVRKLIAREFPGATVDGVIEKAHRVFEAIVWQGFLQLDARARNEWVTERVRNQLGLRGINIGYVIPMAPGESA